MLLCFNIMHWRLIFICTPLVRLIHLVPCRSWALVLPNGNPKHPFLVLFFLLFVSILPSFNLTPLPHPSSLFDICQTSRLSVRRSDLARFILTPAFVFEISRALLPNYPSPHCHNKPQTWMWHPTSISSVISVWSQDRGKISDWRIPRFLRCHEPSCGCAIWAVYKRW